MNITYIMLPIYTYLVTHISPIFEIDDSKPEFNNSVSPVFVHIFPPLDDYLYNDDNDDDDYRLRETYHR